MLQCLLHVKINGPDAKTVIKIVGDEFLSRKKKRKKVGCRSSEDIVGNVVVTDNDVNIEGSAECNDGAGEISGEREVKIEMKSMKTKK